MRYAAERVYDVLAIGAPLDAAFLARVTEWLHGSCGLAVAPAGDESKHISNARIFVAAVSRAALASAGTMDLVRSALGEAHEQPALRFIALVREDVPNNELPPAIVAAGLIRVNGESLTPAAAVAILQAMYPVPPGVDASGREVKDVYFSRSWLRDTGESEPADQVAARASRCGFRLIGDTEDPEFDPDVRLPAIMAGCGGFIAVLPYRAGPVGTSQWILEELRLALASHLPCLVVRDRRVNLNEAVRAAAEVVDVVEYSADGDWMPRLDAALERLNRNYRPPTDPADVLYLTSWSGRIETVRSLVFHITGMDLTTLALPPERRVPTETIRYADVVLCDLDLADARGWMMAGCAMALERKLVLLMAEGQGDSGAWFGVPVHRYVSELDRLGQLHRILRLRRRKVMNLVYTRSAEGGS